jgi:two-component system, OmpR family, sensor kinase
MIRDTIRGRVLVSLLLVALVGAAGLSSYVLREIEAYGQRRLEERIGTQARVTATLVGAAYERSGTSRPVTAKRPFPLDDALHDAYPTPGTILRVLDDKGVVVADSYSGKVGYSLAPIPEIRDALRGKSGVATHTDKAGRHATYVAVPIASGPKIVGVAYASSSTFSIATLLRDYRWQLLAVIILYVVAVLVVAELLSRWLTRPLAHLERATAKFATGDSSARARPEGPRETRALADSFNGMAEEVSRAMGELRAEERRKSRFVSDVSHELRTPLTAIRGAAETLLEDDEVPADMRDRFLATIVSESDRLGRLASDLLALERMEGATGEIPLTRVDLFGVVEHTVRTLEPLTEERGVTLDVHGSSAWVLGERDRLQQVVANLVDNASRMTPSGGTVAVRVTTAGKQARVSVADQGPGIADDDMARVFDRFYRADLSRDRGSGGAGLGLAIVRAIVERHGGTITARNLPGGGAEFAFELPSAG